MNAMVKFLAVSFLAVAAVTFIGCSKNEPAAPGTAANEHAGHDQAQHAQTAEQTTQVAADTTEQTLCPVMGGPINKDIFVEYQGKKVYFCCPSCAEVFQKDPAKYLSKLPQFKE